LADNKEMVEDENKISTVIADDITFQGKLIFKNSLKIKGRFEGTIKTDGHIIIGQEATVSADIKAGVASINGICNGKIKATQRIELYNRSKTTADLITPDMYVERGSKFNGTCIMTGKKMNK